MKPNGVYNDTTEADCSHSEESTDVWRDPDTQCGFGRLRPAFLQIFARIGAFVGVYSISGLLTSTLTVYVNSQVSMLEKQFGFSSTQTGVLMSCNDIGYLCTVIFSGYIARKVHIPRGLGVSTMLYGICGLLCALPFFLQDRSTYSLDSSSAENRTVSSADKQIPMCDAQNITVTKDDESCMSSDTAEFGIEMEENLRSLREAASCPVCMEFYRIPKKLPNCSHVFCLTCIQRNMQIKRDANFPPCPMCRKPIKVSRSHVVSFDSGIAEQTIVDLVKQYETCDICRYKSNPNVRCENCGVYVCENCLPCHNRMKPSHKVVSIIPKRDSTSVPLKQTRTCADHEDQPLDLFCIICYRTLCVHCKEYSHAQCNERFGLERERYQRGFLNYFMNSSGDRQITYRKNKLKRTVYVKDFANAARQWLKPIQTELKSCIKFFEECKTRFKNVGKEKNECCDFQERFHKFVDEIESILVFGQNVYFRTETLLQESTVDADVAVNVLRIEEDCLKLFRQRQKQAGCKLFVDVETIASEHISSNHRHYCTCVLTEFPARCAGIMTLSHYTQLYAGESEANKASAEKLSNNILTCHFARSETFVSNDPSKPGIMSTSSACCIVNCLYQNEALDKYELTNHGIPVRDSGGYICVEEIGNGNICDEPSFLSKINDAVVTYDDFQFNIRIEVSSRWYQINIQKCANLVSYPIHFNLLGNNIYTQIERLSAVRDKCEYVTHFAGNSECGEGLKSFFVYTELSESFPAYGQSFVKDMRALSISANVLKFNKCIYPVNLSDNVYRQHYNRVVKDEQNAFIVAKRLQEATNKGLMSYRTISTLEKENNQIVLMLSEDLHSRPVSPDVESKCDIETAIPVTFFHTDLLCHLESGLYFAKHEENGDVAIGNITFSLKEIKPNIIQTVRQSDTDMHLICKLKPFTMVERKDKYVIVVCSVDDDNSSIVMIRTDKFGPEAIEIVKVDYSLSELKVYAESEDPENITKLAYIPAYDKHPNVVSFGLGETGVKISECDIANVAKATLTDIEMDINGNIMFLLESNDDKSYCVCTKYIMP